MDSLDCVCWLCGVSAVSVQGCVLGWDCEWAEMPEKSSFVALHFVPLRQIVSQIGSLLFRPSCLTSNLPGSTSFSPLQCWGQSPQPTMFNPFYVFLNTDYGNLNSESPICTANTLTHWTIPKPSFGPLECMVGYLRTVWKFESHKQLFL